MKISRTLLVLSAAAMLGGCATQPDGVAYLHGERWLKAELNTYDVIIISVDGTHYIERRDKPVIIEPGLHRIVVQAPPVTGFVYGEQRTLTLDVKPCTRYYIVAVKANPLDSNFTPRVDYALPLGSGCRTS